MIRRLLITACCCITLSAHAAGSQTGIGLTYPLITKDPTKMHGYRISVWHQPESFVWGNFSVYFDASFGHWKVNNNSLPNRSISIYAIAPVLRYYFVKNAFISPFAEVSVGPSYLSKTRLDDRNLGMHFAFQDQIAIGSTFGKEQKLSASLSAMHYSNGSMGASNAGITIPLLFNVQYRF